MNVLLLSLILVSIGALAAPKDYLSLINEKTKIENPFNLRDPFKAPSSGKEGKNQDRGFYMSSKGQYSNIGETPLDQFSIDQIRVVGVLIGKERRALVNLGKDSKQVVILKEGMKIGPEAAELKAILPGGVVLVEKIVNVYGQEEYLETVIPISK